MFVVLYYMDLCFLVLIFSRWVLAGNGILFNGEVSVLVEECGVYGFHPFCETPFAIFTPCRLKALS